MATGGFAPLGASMGLREDARQDLLAKSKLLKKNWLPEVLMPCQKYSCLIKFARSTHANIDSYVGFARMTHANK
jgi:hypothetical protein